MPRGRGGYYDEEELNELQMEAFEYYRRKGYSNLEAYDLATEAVERETGCEPKRNRARADRENAQRADRAEEILARSTRSGRPARSSSIRYEMYEKPEYETPRRHTQQPSRSAQSSSRTEYDRMFQNGGNKYASRTSGKILTPEQIKFKRQQIYIDLLKEGKHPDYARQQSEQFEIRETGKLNAKVREAGYRVPAGTEEDYEEEDDAYAGRNARRGTGRARPAWEEYDGDDDYGAERNRSGYSSCRAEPWENYDTSYPYSDEDLKLIRKKIYDDWCDKGMDPSEVQREAEKWYNSKKKGRGHGTSSRRSGFDSFNDRRDALDDDKDYPRKSRSSRGPRSGKSRPTGRDSLEFDKYFTEEPEDDSRSRRKTSGGSRGYRTEERRPGDGYSSNSYGGYDEPGGVKPAVDLYKLLSVSKIATVDEIKKAHKKLCLKYHPDRVSGGAAAKKVATDKMAQINQACDVLKDHNMRTYYDRTGLIAGIDESPDA